MERHDMAHIQSALELSEPLFLTREKGEQAYHLLKQRLQETPEGQPLVLAFPSEQLVDSSFADETIVRLGEELMEGEFGERCLLLEGLTEDSIHNIEAAIKLGDLKLAFLMVEPAGPWRVIGHLEPSLRETLDIVARRDHLTAPELSAMLNLAVNTAGNRLKRLHNRRLVRREYEILEKGLQYTYHFWQWTGSGNERREENGKH